MCQKKCLLSMVMSCILMLSLCVSSCSALVPSGPGPQLDPVAGQDILEKFPDEIAFIEAESGRSIGAINADTLAVIQKISTENLSDAAYRFSELMTEISLACARSGMAADAVPASMNVTITNETLVVHQPYGPIKGEKLMEVNTGTTSTFSRTAKIGIAAGEEVIGVTVTTSYSADVSYSISGPSDGTKLPNGAGASHRIAIGVLFGTVMCHEYDVYAPEYNISEHVISYYVYSPYATSYTFLASVSMPTYVQPATRPDMTERFSTPTEMNEAIRKTPSRFI